MKSKLEMQHSKSKMLPDISNYIQTMFTSFKSAMVPFHDVWEECWRNFLGEYNTGTKWLNDEGNKRRSQVFVKLTGLKCNTAHAKIMDLSFPKRDGSVPFDCTAVGGSVDPEQAKNATNEYKKEINKHLKRIQIEETMDTGVLEMAILGSAVIKGPIAKKITETVPVERKIAGLPAQEFGVTPFDYVEQERIIPDYEHMPLWEYYTDPNAKSNKEAIGEIHFRRMLPAQFLMLANTPGYIKKNVKEASKYPSLYSEDDDNRDTQLSDRWTGEDGPKDNKISVLEYWGLVPVHMLKPFVESELLKDYDEDDSIEACVVLAANGIPVKVVVNQFGFRPFKVCPYKRIPNQIFGVGVAESMKDSQAMVNSAARLTIDNKAIAGMVQWWVNTSKIDTKRTGDLGNMYPNKVWFSKGNATQQEAIQPLITPDVTRGLQELMIMFERFADEETGLPKFTHGDTASFLNKTATGISMLMGQANVNLKPVMKNIDNYWIEPIVEEVYDFISENNQQQFPIEIVATGTDSLIAKEIKMEQQFKALQLTNDPRDAMFVDRYQLMKEIFQNLEMGHIMVSDEQAQAIMQQMQQQSQTPPPVSERLKGLETLFPFFTPNEKGQVLAEVGIEPDIMGTPLKISENSQNNQEKTMGKILEEQQQIGSNNEE